MTRTADRYCTYQGVSYTLFDYYFSDSKTDITVDGLPTLLRWGIKPKYISTANWDGYRLGLIVQDNQLLVDWVEIMLEPGMDLPVIDGVQGYYQNESNQVDWYSKEFPIWRDLNISTTFTGRLQLVSSIWNRNKYKSGMYYKIRVKGYRLDNLLDCVGFKSREELFLSRSTLDLSTDLMFYDKWLCVDVEKGKVTEIEDRSQQIYDNRRNHMLDAKLVVGKNYEGLYQPNVFKISFKDMTTDPNQAVKCKVNALEATNEGDIYYTIVLWDKEKEIYSGDPTRVHSVHVCKVSLETM